MPEPKINEKKASNTLLGKARGAKKDEFYTQLSYIEKELHHYKEYFRSKIIFCNCDDPEESHFWKYFSENFEHLGLKKLVSTHYETEKPSYKLEIVADINRDGRINKFDTVRTPLTQNGDFRSPECIEILKICDIVMTNPPFSLFREYVAQLFEYDKKFVIIGNLNAITYKETFKLIKEDRIWPGCTLDGRNIWFRIPDSYEKYHKIENGIKYAFVASTIWFTNLDHKKRHEDIILYKTYNPTDYPSYDNYDAINIDRTKDIPMDYAGAMGVPITFLLKHNPEQFDIINANDIRKNEKVPLKGHGLIKDKDSAINGKPTYVRIVIKNKKL